jgi:hypothetical protein
MKPGIQSMSSEQYHAADGVSRSMLEWLAPPKTPAHFKAKWVDKLIPDEETPALRMGSLVHRCVLEPETMTEAFHLKPDGLKFSTKEGKAWQDAHEDKPILSADEAAKVHGIRDSVWAHPMASRILKHSEFERSAFAEDNGLLLKARFDALPKSGNLVADLKTCDDASEEACCKAVSKYAYYKQAAFYLRVANLLGLDRAAFVFIFVEKTPPYLVAVRQLDDIVLEAGTMMINRDLQVLRTCRESNRWPGYGDTVLGVALPDYEMRRLEQLS